MSTDAEVAGGSARLEDPIEAANHYFDYLDEHQMGLHGGGSGTNPDTDTDIGTDTGTDTGTGATPGSKRGHEDQATSSSEKLWSQRCTPRN